MARVVNDKDLQALKAHNARARKLTVTVLGDKLEFVVRPASRQEWDSYKMLVNNPDPTKNSQARKQLLIFCLMSPDPKAGEIEQIIDLYPGLPDTVFPELAKMAGIAADVALGE